MADFFPVQNETQILLSSNKTRKKQSLKEYKQCNCAGAVLQNVWVPHLVTTVILDHFKPTNKEIDPNVVWSHIRGGGWGSVVRKRC